MLVILLYWLYEDFEFSLL